MALTQSLKERLLRYLSMAIMAGIGFYFFGYYGLVLGFTGSWIVNQLHLDEGGGNYFERVPKTEEVEPKEFMVSCLILAAAVIKSDNEINDLELTYIRRFLMEQFGEEIADRYEPVLLKALREPFDWRKATVQIRKATSPETRLQLLFFLFGIAGADYNTDYNEVMMIEQISWHLGLPKRDFESIKAMFYEEIDAYYKILEISPSASDQSLREAYRSMSLKYHPDKLAHLGKVFEHAAQQKYLRVRYAYETICKERGLKP